MPPAAIPHAVLLGPWLAACLRGDVGPDDMAEVVRGDDPRHLVLTDDGVHELQHLPALVGGATATRVVVPGPGDPAGLAGPGAFNTAAIDAGSAVLLGGLGLGLVPEYDARTVLWHVRPAVLGPPDDPSESSRQLRRELTVAATALAEDGVADWEPEIPDLLMNPDSRPSPHLPRGYDPSRLQIIDRALLALEIVALAPHHPALSSLAAAARRALGSNCSDTLSPS